MKRYVDFILWLTGRWRWWPSQRSWIDCEVSGSDSVDGNRCPMGRHPSEQSPPKSAARHLGTHPTTAADNASGRSTPSGSSQLVNISCTNLQLGSTKIKKINYHHHHHHHNSTSVTVISHTSIRTEYSLSPFIIVYHRLSPFITDYHRLSPFIIIYHRLSPYITVYANYSHWV